MRRPPRSPGVDRIASLSVEYVRTVGVTLIDEMPVDGDAFGVTGTTTLLAARIGVGAAMTAAARMLDREAVRQFPPAAVRQLELLAELLDRWEVTHPGAVVVVFDCVEVEQGVPGAVGFGAAHSGSDRVKGRGATVTVFDGPDERRAVPGAGIEIHEFDVEVSGTGGHASVDAIHVTRGVTARQRPASRNGWCLFMS